MLKTVTLALGGRDAHEPLQLTELPALLADRHARAALHAINVPLDGGVVSLAFEHMHAVMQLQERAFELLSPFVQASRTIREWHNVLVVQQAAIALHANFMIGRPVVGIPVALQVECIKRTGEDAAVNFCSSALATVLHCRRATYHELETTLSTEDVFNLVELINVEAVRDWRAHQSQQR